ncbi:hypothetical protein [Sodalis-like endosymbiont of Proechinophthirus fluctus]|uniref:hypothetical protein n=1 Tax=Sodalis-like endosymbiont of Proechinophthirus fluctus TaxID=1462730 RepID=UPI00082A69C7|nr:hypothetical protein [Sodalis-like endosymbiont of Proechinophthirus fluctus]
MIDSDLNLQYCTLHYAMIISTLLFSFHRGKMIDKLSSLVPEVVPAYCCDVVRPKLVDHVNGAFLVPSRQAWLRMCPII